MKNIADPLDLQRLEQRLVDRLPVVDHRLALELARDRREYLANAVGVGGLDLDHLDRVPAQQQGLRVGMGMTMNVLS
jgi:hypothetical protein